MTRVITNATPSVPGPWYYLYFDGSCYPNPGGIMGLGWALYAGTGSVSLGSRGQYPATPPPFRGLGPLNMITFGSAAAGYGTNNRAEYLSLLEGLRHALYLTVRRLVVVGDSQLVIRQMNRVWACKDAELRKLQTEGLSIAAGFDKIVFRHVKRGENEFCDSLAAEKPAVPSICGPAKRYLEQHGLVPGRDCKLADRQAAYLRWYYEARGLSTAELGRIFNIDRKHAWRIATGERYNHVGEEHLCDF